MHTKGSKKAVASLLNFYCKNTSYFPLSCECQVVNIYLSGVVQEHM